MKLLTTLFICACTLTAGAQSISNHDLPIKARQQRVDMGMILWHNPAKATFSLQNTGSAPLKIDSVKVGCGCTTAEWDAKSIAPGAEAEIKVSYDAELLGRFERELEVYAAGSSKPLFLSLAGDVVTEIRSNPADFTYHVGTLSLTSDNIEFDDVRRGDTPTVKLGIFNNSRQTYTPELMHLPSYLKAEAEPAEIRPGRSGIINVTLDSEKLRYGLTQTSVYLSRFQGDRVSADNELYVSITLLPELPDDGLGGKPIPVAKFDPTEIDLGEFGDKKKLKAEWNIQNDGQGNLSISALQVYNPGISVSLNESTIKPGKSAKLKITLNRDTHNFKGRRRILLITNDPKNPKIVIDIKVQK